LPPGWELWVPDRPARQHRRRVLATVLGGALLIAVVGAWLPSLPGYPTPRPNPALSNAALSNAALPNVRLPRAKRQHPRSGPTPSTTPFVAPVFLTCRALNSAYPHGVGLPTAIDRTAGVPVTNFGRSTSLYGANAARDRDSDGIACERP
jgi:hypothetical protein